MTFNVYKNLRGSAPYYQKAKQNLFATIRQHGSPTIFQTVSSAEFEWDQLCKQIYETVYNEQIDIDDIKRKDNKWKNQMEVLSTNNRNSSCIQSDRDCIPLYSVRL